MRVADLKKTALVYYYLSSIFCITSLFFAEFVGPVYLTLNYTLQSHTHMHTHTPFQWLFFQVKLSHPLITFLSIYSEIKIELRLKLCFITCTTL